VAGQNQQNNSPADDLAEVLDTAFTAFTGQLDAILGKAIDRLGDILSSVGGTPSLPTPQNDKTTPTPGTKAEKGPDLGASLDKIGDSLGRIPVVGDFIRASIAPLIPILSSLGKGTTKTDAKAATKSDAKAGTTTDSTATSKTSLQAALQQLTVAVDQAVIVLRGLAGRGGVATATPVKPNEEAKGEAAAGGAEEAAGGLAGGLAMAAGAAVAAAGALEALFAKIQTAVQAFSPATIELFNQAIDNFNATVGRAFVVVFTDLTEVIRQATGQIAPVMRALAPIVKEAADALGNFLVRYIQLAVERFQSLVPIIDLLVKAFEPVLEILLLVNNVFTVMVRAVAMVVEVLLTLSGVGIILQALTTVLKIVNESFKVLTEAMNILQVVIDFAMEAFKALVTSFFPFTDILKNFQDAIRVVIRNMYVLAVAISRFFGLDGLVDKLIQSIQAKLERGDTAAQATQILGFEQLSKNLALKAAAASGGGQGGVDNEREFWRQVLEDAKQARDSQKSFQGIVEAGFKEVIDKLLKLIPDPLQRAAEKAKDVLGDVGGGGGERSFLQKATDPLGIRNRVLGF
jgi:hypothetical protein